MLELFPIFNVSCRPLASQSWLSSLACLAHRSHQRRTWREAELAPTLAPSRRPPVTAKQHLAGNVCKRHVFWGPQKTWHRHVLQLCLRIVACISKTCCVTMTVTRTVILSQWHNDCHNDCHNDYHSDYQMQIISAIVLCNKRMKKEKPIIF